MRGARGPSGLAAKLGRTVRFVNRLNSLNAIYLARGNHARFGLWPGLSWRVYTRTEAIHPLPAPGEPTDGTLAI